MECVMTNASPFPVSRCSVMELVATALARAAASAGAIAQTSSLTPITIATIGAGHVGLG